VISTRRLLATSLLILSLTFGLVYLVACQSDAPHTAAAEPRSEHPRAQYLRNEKKDRVIVFVHGIFGSPTETWMCPNGGFYWPKALLNDPAFADSDVYVAAYDSPYFGNHMTIDEVVSNLANRFQSDGVFSHREVVFVAHSLGGLVVQRFLITHREYAKQVPFIAFYATPETGAQVAQLGHIFSADPLLKEMFSGPENDYLLNLENEWIAANFMTKRYCAYEKKPTNGIWIVDRLSGTRNCTNKTPIPINENHINIVKPCSTQDDAYITLKNLVIENPIAPAPIALKDDVQTREWRSPGLNVDCNRTNSGTLQASVALDPKYEERVIAVTAKYDGADNIKQPTGPTVLGAPGSVVNVSYGFNGQDKEWTGNCPGGGHATVVVTFTVARRIPVL
jgi:Alpha/beta hydrolase family